MSSSAGNGRHPISASWLPLAASVGLAALGWLPDPAAHPVLRWSLWAAAALVVAWTGVLSAVAGGRAFRYRFAPRAAHYVQSAVQLSIFVYWSRYFAQVVDQAELIVAQVLFAYALDMLLCWSRRREYVLGFGPVPVVLSVNLFLWFRDDWFYLQLGMILVGYVAKELVVWRRGDRLAHIFNPSALPLALFALGLLVAGRTEITWSEQIAVSLARPEWIYLWIFLAGLVVQALFRVTPVTLGAAATLVGLGAAYQAATGIHYFVDSTIPAAVFLGMHLLITDPATSPRTTSGRLLFGALYGAGVFAAYGVLAALGEPRYFDKLLCVPLMNLSVRVLDRWTGPQGVGGWLDRLPLAAATPGRKNLALMAAWVALFVSLEAGGRLDGRHPGESTEFWRDACAEGRRHGCRNLEAVLAGRCGSGSGVDCLELGGLLAPGGAGGEDAVRSIQALTRSCELGVEAGCDELARRAFTLSPDALFRDPAGRREPLPLPTYAFDVLSEVCRDGGARACFLAGYALERGLGVERDATAALDRYARACAGGDARACGARALRLLLNEGGGAVPYDEIVAGFTTSCEAGNARDCANLALMYRDGDGVESDPDRVAALLDRACDLGMAEACEWRRGL